MSTLYPKRSVRAMAYADRAVCRIFFTTDNLTPQISIRTFRLTQAIAPIIHSIAKVALPVEFVTSSAQFRKRSRFYPLDV